VEDHHVDRPEVDARQRVKPTGTNRSSGLILTLSPRAAVKPQRRTDTMLYLTHNLNPATDRVRWVDLVARAGGLHPIPSRTRP
jgi:hypothetical protein